MRQVNQIIMAMLAISPNHRRGEAVTKRKVSGGSRSMDRFKHTAHMLTGNFKVTSTLTTVNSCRFL